MKRIIQKWWGILFVLAFIVGIFSVTIEVQAEKDTPYLFPKKKLTIDYYAENYTNIGVFELLGTSSEVKVLELRSGDEEVADVAFHQKRKSFTVTAKKPGKTVISFRLKYKGKTKKYKYFVKVKKAPNPMKSFKLGNIQLKSEFNQKTVYNFKVKKALKTKLKIKVRKGWKVQKIRYYNGKKSKRIRNNSAVTLRRGNSIYVAYKQKKNNKVLEYSVYCVS